MLYLSFLLLTFFLTFISFQSFALKKNCIQLKNYVYCFDGYYQSMLPFYTKSSEPQFIINIPQRNLANFSYYFKLFSYYKKLQKKAIHYEFYQNQRKKSQFYFVYDRLSKKATLKKAIWYNNKNNYQEVYNYFLSSKNQKKTYRHEFLYYNDFGVLVKKIQEVYDKLSKKRIRRIVDSSFLLESQVLGKTEY